MRPIVCVALGVTALAGIVGCDFDTSLAPEVELRVVVDDTGVLPLETDLGYQIELERCRVAIDTIEFTTDGEMHASLLDPLYDLVVPTAYAHPGHYAGGEIVGELTGGIVFDWREGGRELGMATMLQADYSGANFTFARAQPGKGVPPDDRIVGHTFDIAGTATIDGRMYTFEAVLDEDEDRRVVGLPFELTVDDSTDADLGLSFAVIDPHEEDTVFDGVDFAALDDDGDRHVVLEPDTEQYNRLRRNLQVHDHYTVVVK
jgi:hypothetical protein